MFRHPITVLSNSIARRGLWQTLCLIPRNIPNILGRRMYADQEFDREYGTDTSSYVGLSGLNIAATVSSTRTGTEYRPIFRKRFAEIMREIPLRYEDYLFIDIGSGKGKALLLASDFPFQEIVGVEFAHELHEIAVRNINTYRSPQQRCKRISSICMDAGTFEFPPVPTLLFMYHPFGPPVLGSLLQNLRRSRSQASCPLVLAYAGPVHGAFVQEETRDFLTLRQANEHFWIFASTG